MNLAALPATFGVDPWGQEQYQQLPLGSIGYDDFGNMYRYVKQGAVLGVSGDLYTRPAVDTNFVDLAVQAAAPLITTGTSKVPNTTVALTLGSTAFTANLLDNGRAVVSVTPGIGQQFTIKSHSVTAISSTASITFYEPLAVALTTSSKMTLLPNPANGVIINPTTFTGNPMGIMIAPIAISYFGWVGTHGVFGALSDNVASAVGFGISPSTTTAGCITKAVTLKDSIGYHIVAAASAQVEPQWFNIN